MTIGLVSLGCAKNAVDLQVMAGHLVKRGHALAPDPDRCDALLVNTCSFIASAREEAAAEIERACELKRRGRVGRVVVTGCFPQRYPEETLELFPEVDAILGVDALDRICDAVEGRPAPKIKPKPCRVFDPPVPALRFTGPAFAYLKIAEGCAHKCAYCAIPGIRGKYRSRSKESILAEARALVASGCRELDVVAQDPMLWGCDLGGGANLVALLKALDEIPGDFWIRVLYSYPSEITDGFLAWLRESPHAVRYVDVPVQHTDSEVLKRMARGSAVRATREAAARIRAAVPDVTLRTTVMTGFPGETGPRFRRLLADLAEMDFDRLGAFAFSPERGTAAAAMKGRPARRVAEERERLVMAAQKKRWAAKARRFRGRTFRALVVAPGVARLACQAPDVDGVTRLVGGGAAAAGDFVSVKILRVRGFDFDAEIVAADDFR